MKTALKPNERTLEALDAACDVVDEAEVLQAGGELTITVPAPVWQRLCETLYTYAKSEEDE